MKLPLSSMLPIDGWSLDQLTARVSLPASPPSAVARLPVAVNCCVPGMPLSVTSVGAIGAIVTEVSVSPGGGPDPSSPKDGPS